MDAKQKVLEVINNHDLMSVATVNEKGNPKERSVDFAHDEKDKSLCFITHKMSDNYDYYSNN